MGAEVSLPKWSHISVAADISGTYGTQQFSTIRQTLHQFTYLAGPRVSQRAGRLRIFEHVLIGAAELKGQAGRQADSDPKFALALGAGADGVAHPISPCLGSHPE